MDRGQFLADGIDDKLPGSNADGLTVSLDAFQQRLGDLQIGGIVRRTFHFFTHLRAHSTKVGNQPQYIVVTYLNSCIKKGKPF